MNANRRSRELLAASSRVGLLALTLELYEQLVPGLRRSRREMAAAGGAAGALPQVADVPLRRRPFTAREDVESQVARWEAGRRRRPAGRLPDLRAQPDRAAGPAAHAPADHHLEHAGVVRPSTTSSTMRPMIDNHGVHGTQDLANVLVRSGVPFHYVTSHLSDADGLRRAGRLLPRPRRPWRACGRAALGLLGYPFPGMGDFAVDTTHLAATLGCQWTSLAVEDYIQRAAAARPAPWRRWSAEYRTLLRPGRRRDRRRPGRHRPGRIGAAGDRRRARLDALSYQFMAFGEDERTVTLPFVAASRLMADGIGFAGEGDLVGAAGTWLLNRLHPPASFSEIFTIDFAGNALFMSHMGEANVAMARARSQGPLVARPQPITRTRGRQLALVTSFRARAGHALRVGPGPRQRWRLIASRRDDRGLRAAAGPAGSALQARPLARRRARRG